MPLRVRGRCGRKKPVVKDTDCEIVFQDAHFREHTRKMLTHRDLRIDYTFLKVFSIVGIFPAEFNIRNGKCAPLDSIYRIGISRIWFFLGCAYATYTNTRLVQSLFFKEYYRADHLPFHIQIGFFSAVGAYWAYRIFHVNPQINNAIFNQLYNEEGDENLTVNRAFSTQDWLLLTIPFALFFCCVTIFVVMYIHDRESIQFLICLLPKKYHTGKPFAATLVFETAMLVYYLATAFQSIFLQVSFFENSAEKFMARLSFIRSRVFLPTFGLLLRECKHCRMMQLNIRLFNDLNAYIIFAIKLYWLTVAIENYYFGIRLFNTKSIQAVCLLSLGVFHTGLFSVMYDRAFSVPRSMKELTEEIRVMSVKLADSDQRKYLQKTLSSISTVGIRVGSFHLLERVSTPNYVSFIAEKVLGLLVTS